MAASKTAFTFCSESQEILEHKASSIDHIKYIIKTGNPEHKALTMCEVRGGVGSL